MALRRSSLPLLGAIIALFCLPASALAQTPPSNDTPATPAGWRTTPYVVTLVGSDAETAVRIEYEHGTNGVSQRPERHPGDDQHAGQARLQDPRHGQRPARAGLGLAHRAAVDRHGRPDGRLDRAHDACRPQRLAPGAHELRGPRRRHHLGRRPRRVEPRRRRAAERPQRLERPALRERPAPDAHPRRRRRRQRLRLDRPRHPHRRRAPDRHDRAADRLADRPGRRDRQGHRRPLGRRRRRVDHRRRRPRHRLARGPVHDLRRRRAHRPDARARRGRQRVRLGAAHRQDRHDRARPTSPTLPTTGCRPHDVEVKASRRRAPAWTASSGRSTAGRGCTGPPAASSTSPTTGEYQLRTRARDVAGNVSRAAARQRARSTRTRPPTRPRRAPGVDVEQPVPGGRHRHGRRLRASTASSGRSTAAPSTRATRATWRRSRATARTR